jgi:hypothetical protein
LITRETDIERAERMKLLYDINKHLSTLSTGTTVIISALLEKLFNQSNFKILIVVSFFLLAISLIGSVWGMFGFGAYSRASFNNNGDPTPVGAVALTVALMSFCGAIIFFMVFSALNFVF